jgi:sulfur carrier protein
MITLTVNGKARELEDALTLQRYLESLGVNLQFVAVAYNGQVVDRAEFGNLVLKQGDDLEIVRPVGGG